MNRHQLREQTFKMVFHCAFYNGEELTEQIDLYLEQLTEVAKEEKMLLKGHFLEVYEQIPGLDEKISAVSQGWKVNRIGKVEVSILRLALFEMLHDEEVPVKVAINEAVELAKKYGGESSPQFINGILAKYA